METNAIFYAAPVSELMELETEEAFSLSYEVESTDNPNEEENMLKYDWDW